MRTVRRAGLLLLFLLVGSGCATNVTAAFGEEATEAAPSEPPATVSFANQQPLTLEGARIEKLVEEGGLEVAVHNGLGKAQPVTVELTGLGESEDEGIATLFPQPQRTLSVGVGKTAVFTIPVAQPSPEPAEGSYQATLLAYGKSGGLARRQLTIVYPPPAGEEEEAAENSLSPDRAIDITVHAVNYLPSLLSGLCDLGFFLAIVLVLVAILFRDRLRSRLNRLPVALVALAVLIGAVSLVGVIRDGIWDQPRFHAISARPIDLSPKVPDGTRGTVSSEDGSIAQLIAAEGELRPHYLAGANKFTGKYNLSGEAGKSEAVATVTVRDFWIYAALTITLGLLVGFLLHRWFQEKRPKAKLRARLQGLRDRYSGGLKALEERDTGRPYERLSIDERVLAREIEINSLLDAGETTQATEKLLSLGVYLEKLFALREARYDLDNVAAELAGTPQMERLRLDLEEADGYQEALHLLGEPIDSPGLDSDETEIKEALAETTAQAKLIKKTARQVAKAIRHLLAADAIRHAARGDEVKRLDAIEGALIDAGQSALQADSLEDLAKAEAADDKALRDLEALSRPIHDDPAAPAIRRVRLDQTLATRGIFETIEAEDLVNQLVFDAEGPRSTVHAEISSAVITGTGPEDEAVHFGDRVQFTIEFDTGARPGFDEVEVDFGDGTRARYNLPRPGDPLLATHPYRTSGVSTVVVRSLPGGTEIGRHELSIDPEPRALELQRQLADGDKLVNRAAFVLAVGSGMFALYFADPSWGQPMDYLGAFVWGGATGEGVKFAAALADRVWPVP